MLFSAIGVMVIYLNVPTTTTTIPVTIPSDEPTTITLPTAEETVPTDADNSPEWTEQPIADPEAPAETAPTLADDAAEQTEPTPNPVEWTPVEPTPAQQ